MMKAMTYKKNKRGKQNRSATQNEYGSIMIYILIAVGLLAALSFAVSQSGRGSGGTVGAERQRLLATEILEYGEIISNTVAQLRLRGVPVNQLSFARPEDAGFDDQPEAEIFNPAGGAAIYQPPPREAVNIIGQDYLFLAGNQVPGAGTTCVTADCADLVLAIPNVSEAVCLQINRLLSIGGAPPDTPMDLDHLFSPGANPFTAPVSMAVPTGQREGCVNNTTPTPSIFVYYKLLLAR